MIVVGSRNEGKLVSGKNDSKNMTINHTHLGWGDLDITITITLTVPFSGTN